MRRPRGSVRRGPVRHEDSIAKRGDRLTRASWGLLLASTVLSLYVLELLLRVWYVAASPIAAGYPMGLRQIGRRLEVRQMEYTIDLVYNRFGFRDADFGAAPTPARRTILFLGDSFVEGMGVAEADRFSDLVVRGFGPGWRDVNAGQLATQPLGYYRNLCALGLALRPAWVVVSLFLGNDFLGARRLPVPATDRVQEHLPADVDARVAGPLSELRLVYLRRATERLLGGREYLAARGAVASFWEFYVRRPIDRTFLMETAGLDEQSFARLTANMDPEVVRASSEGRLNPAFLLEALRVKRAADGGPEPAGYGDADLAIRATTATTLARSAIVWQRKQSCPPCATREAHTAERVPVRGPDLP